MKSLVNALVALLVATAPLLSCGSADPPQAPAATCKTDSECGDLRCDPKSGCVACVFDSHCAAGERCSGGACYTPAACDEDDDCAGSEFPICDPGAQQCVRCLSDEQCGDSAHCRDGACRAFEKCEREQDCAGSGHCDLGSGECVACLTKGDCNIGSDCVAGQCQVVCKVEADCAALGSHCASTGHCGECATDQHCPEVYNCQAGSCVRDVCAQGTTTCDETTRAVALCSANGASLTLNTCATGQSCARGELTATCQPWTCAPGADRCSADGSSILHCADDGLSVESEEPCADPERCVAGHCVTLSCEPNAAFCKEGASYLCNFDGTESTLIRACGDSELCDTGTGKCVTERCAPGSSTCAGHDRGVCREDGKAFDFEACGKDQTCTDGECRDLVCAPNSTFCSGKQVQRCNATGTQITTEQTCQNECVSSGNSATCSFVSCTPGAALCSGQVATVCKVDGTGPAPDGVDCAAVGGHCQAGTCEPNACVPNERFCVDDYMYQCASNGQSSSQYSSYACSSWYHNYSSCNPATGLCQTKQCTPNTNYCSGTTAYSCDSTGYVATAGENCATSNKLCSAGVCIPKVCDAGSYACNGNDIEYCSGGTSWTAYSTCAASQYCLDGYYYCQSDVCTAGKPVCNGNATTTCKSDGSGPTDAGTACGAGKTCQDGACKALTCTPYAIACSGGHLHQCNSTGTSTTLYQYCVAESFCDTATNVCKTDVCPAGKPYCDGETYKTCKADGSGAVDAGTVCATTNKVCTLSGCAALALETLGNTGTTGAFYGTSDNFFGNVIKVSQTRKLTKLETHLAVSGGPVSAHWLVFSSTDGVTFYQASDTPANLANTADAWVASAALTVELQAGLYYLIGLEVAPLAGGTVTYHTSNVSTPALSFAQVLGSSTKAVAGPPASLSPTRNASLYYMRFSTALP